MRRLFKLFKPRFGNNSQQQKNETTTVVDESVAEPIGLYTADSPISNPGQDKFKRLLFAQRIAQTIASRSDSSSIVIGIYGPWGNGKTTVLNFIEQNLNNSPNIVCIKFNPWRFTDEASLIQGFFQTLADGLGKSITSNGKKIANWLEEYSEILVPISFTLGGIVKFEPGKSIQSTAKIFSSTKLEALKKNLEKVLKDEAKRIVILMDDIDRLDKNEIQTVFKLVKLSADFEYTAYILAFDEEMVAAALSEKYGSGDIKEGRKFLEKIIQVPLNLPQVNRLALLEYCIKGIEEVLKDTNIQFSEEEFRYHFFDHFVDGLEIRLKTPRMAKRYMNALAFSLPILKGEVNGA